MRDAPPSTLLEQLARLELATADEVRAAGAKARRWIHEIPLFESFWIDALTQARLLTPYQAAELNAGRGDSLRVGPYLIERKLHPLGDACFYLARNAKTKKKVHLLVATLPPAYSTANDDALASKTPSGNPNSDCLVMPEDSGSDATQVWAAYPCITGTPACEWLSYQGRLPPRAVLEIARQLVAAFSKRETAENPAHTSRALHGDISQTSLWLGANGEARLTRSRTDRASSLAMPVVAQSIPWHELDYIAPERIRVNTIQPSTVAGDAYACGMLWWHMLTGRPPLLGGDHPSKLRAARKPVLADVRQFAPDVDNALATAIVDCTRHDPAERPTFAELAERLGPPTAAGRRQVATALARSGRRTIRPSLSVHVIEQTRRAAPTLATAAACVALLAAASWPLWRPTGRRAQPQLAMQTAKSTAPVAASKNAPPRELSPSSRPANTQVRQANYQLPIEPRKSQPTKTRHTIRLPVDREIPGGWIPLQPGCIVRGQENEQGARPRIVVPQHGFSIAVEGVCFENVDFIWRENPDALVYADHPAMIDVACRNIEFVNCTFQASASNQEASPTAIRLSGQNQSGVVLPPAVNVRMEKCVMRGVSSGIDCQASGPAGMKLVGTLHLGPGPLVNFPRPRPVDAPTIVSLDHVTLRGASALAALHSGESTDSWGSITIQTVGCVLSPAEDGALLAFSGTSSPMRWINAIQWQGQGTLISPECTVARWTHDHETEVLADDALMVDGLAASALEFAAEATDLPSNSVITRWAAPVQSDQAPGIAGDLPNLPPIEFAGRAPLLKK